jgi:molybdate transport system substrate-binding protein
VNGGDAVWIEAGAILFALRLAVSMSPRSSPAAEPVQLYAAGTLRAALTEIAHVFEAREHVAAEAKFGASGLLRDEIAKGAAAEVFASANMEHPLSVSRKGKAGPVVLFARNRFCALARPGSDEPHRPDAGSGREARHIDPEC